jgi:hypothetical protein
MSHRTLWIVALFALAFLPSFGQSVSSLSRSGEAMGISAKERQAVVALYETAAPLVALSFKMATIFCRVRVRP